MSVSFIDFLPENNVFEFNCGDKETALNQLITHLAKTTNFDEKKLHAAIWKREEQMSTGLSHGIAVPHARIADFGEPIVAIGYAKDGLEDYIGIDDEVVKLVIMILSDLEDRQRYLTILRSVSDKLAGDTSCFEKLQNASGYTPKMLEILKQNQKD